MKNGIIHLSVASKCGFLWLYCVDIKKAHTILTKRMPAECHSDLV